MTVTSQPVAAPSSVELEVQRIRGLVQVHRFVEAVTAAVRLVIDEVWTRCEIA